MTNLFKIRFLYSEGMIANLLNKLNRISKRAVLEIVVTKDPLKFGGYTAVAPHTVQTTKKNSKPHICVITYLMTPPPDPEDLGSWPVENISVTCLWAFQPLYWRRWRL